MRQGVTQGLSPWIHQNRQTAAKGLAWSHPQIGGQNRFVTPLVDFEDYRALIQLDTPWRATPTQHQRLAPSDRQALVQQLLQELSADRDAGDAIDTPERARLRLYSLLIQRPPDTISQPILLEIDRLLADEAQERTTHAVPKAQCSAGALHLWRGDITTLRCDAIVNAANSALLGCFRPNHPCIDNAIHAIAGPRLRDDCHQIMQLQEHPEPTGIAKITRAYHLPARFVLHTVGPIHRGDDQLAKESRLLSNSYKACLDLANRLGDIRSLAFCCISTGVFGFPAELACPIAVRSVRNWLDSHQHCFESIIFNVFSRRDESLYEQVLEGHRHG